MKIFVKINWQKNNYTTNSIGFLLFLTK